MIVGDGDDDIPRPRSTGCLRRSIVRNLPLGCAWTMSILNEFVPMSIAARSFVGVIGFGFEGCVAIDDQA